MARKMRNKKQRLKEGLKVMKRKGKILVATMLLATLLCGNIVQAASKSETKYISSKYGDLKGSVHGIYNGTMKEKQYWSRAETGAKVVKIRSKLSVQYATTGVEIGSGETTGWKYDAKSACTYTYEMHHFKNKITGKYDGFKDTKCKAYGTADAIVTNAYVVYTSLTY